MISENFQYKTHTLLRFEVQVAEHCNLNCRNCMHYSPLAEPEFLDLEEYERDIRRLSELFCGEVDWIRLMGGEPLLNPELPDIMKLTRSSFPYGHVRIVTNGVLIDKMDNEFYEVCRDNKIEICVTKYPVNMDYQKMSEEIADRGIKFALYGEGESRKPTMWRFPIDIRGDYDPDWNFYHCRGANDCLTLSHGRMYTCAPPAHAHHLKKYFDIDIALSERNGIDIYKAKSPEEIMEHMVHPIPFCRYCDYGNRGDYEDDWSVSEKDRYDWVSFTFCKEDINYLKGFPDVYVYGAGKWGIKTVLRLQTLGVNVTRVLVMDKNNNPDAISGVSVAELGETGDRASESVVLIAVAGRAKIEIQHNLLGKGFRRIIPLMHEP